MRIDEKQVVSVGFLLQLEFTRTDALPLVPGPVQIDGLAVRVTLRRVTVLDRLAEFTDLQRVGAGVDAARLPEDLEHLTAELVLSGRPFLQKQFTSLPDAPVHDSAATIAAPCRHHPVEDQLFRDLADVVGKREKRRPRRNDAAFRMILAAKSDGQVIRANCSPLWIPWQAEGFGVALPDRLIVTECPRVASRHQLSRDSSPAFDQ